MKIKRIKQILAIALASVVTVGMLSTVSFAQGEEDSSEDTTATTTEASTAAATTGSSIITTLPISKTVKVTKNGTVLPSENFQFTMVPASEEDVKDQENGVSIEVGPELVTNTIGIQFGNDDSTSSGKVTKPGSFTLSFKEAFDHAGIYRYYVYETGTYGLTGDFVSAWNEDGTSASSKYITFDDTKYVVDLYVTYDSDSGKYVVTNTLVRDAADLEKKPKSIEFTNTISCATLKIYKTVEGTEYRTGQLYKFQILIPVGGDSIKLTEGQKIKAVIKDANDNVVNDDRSDDEGYVTLKVGGTNIEADMNENAAVFYLKDGEYLEIPGLPVSMIYKVQEVTGDYTVKEDGKDVTYNITDEDYTVTYDYAEYGLNETETKKEVTNQDGNVISKGTINTQSNEIVFRNTRDMDTADTGINMDVAPYLIIVLAVVCGGILLILKKRKAAH
jgi:hypothetical protein